MKKLMFLLCLVPMAALAATTYMTQGDFIKTSVGAAAPAKVHWLSKEDRAVARQILGHEYAGARLRYWQNGPRTAWVIDEIGKERPITFGVVIEKGRVANARVLTYRESRGGEIHRANFSKQFVGGELKADYKFSQHVDGISGATMSVDAMTNVTRLALYLDSRVN